MPARRLLMRKIREVLRLKYERELSHRAIAQACAIGVGYGHAVSAKGPRKTNFLEVPVVS